MSARIDHDRAFELIPWLVNETLPQHERAAVEAHVRDCVPCRLELKAQRSLSAAVLAQPTVHTSAARGFERLLDRLDAAPRPASAASRRAAAAARPRWLVTGVALATLAAALVIVAWPGLLGDSAPSGYTTLGDPPETSAGAVQLDLVFVESLAVEERERFIAALGATIVTGPSEIGRYRVRLDSALSDAALARMLAELDADKRIRFAGRAFAEAPQ